jgi:hypothetical protein
MTWRKAAVLGPVASPATIVASVISGHLVLTGDTTISADLAPGSLLLLLATVWMLATLLGAGLARSFLLLLVEGAPLLHRVQ